MRNDLLIIDPQNDFCDPRGALFVRGADNDMVRLQKIIRQSGTSVDRIHVTLDTHHWRDIAHPAFWVDPAGQAPAHFTIIQHQDVLSGRWKTARETDRPWALDYTRRLAEQNRYALCIWPPHCLIGSWGTQVYTPLFETLLQWEKEQGREVNYIYKGLNPLTEHYSALQADVPIEGDETTSLNKVLIDELKASDRLTVAGEAMSHCVRFTLQDLMKNVTPDFQRNIVILQDAMSPVPGFEKEGREFLDFVTANGTQSLQCDQWGSFVTAAS